MKLLNYAGYDLCYLGQFLNYKALHLCNKTNIKKILIQKFKKIKSHVTRYNFECFIIWVKYKCKLRGLQNSEALSSTETMYRLYEPILTLIY